MYQVYNDEYLMHHGIKGMHWGIRRYQSYDVTGPRKGGKTGTEVGDAKSQNRQLYKKSSKLESVSSSKSSLKAEPKLSRSEKRLVKAQFKADKAHEAYAKSVVRAIDNGNVYIKKGPDGKHNEVYMTSNDLSEKQQKLEKASSKVDRKVESFKKKYGAEALSSLEKKAKNISALAEGRKRIEEMLSYSDERFKYFQNVKLPD